MIASFTSVCGSPHKNENINFPEAKTIDILGKDLGRNGHHQFTFNPHLIFLPLSSLKLFHLIHFKSSRNFT